MLKKTLTICVLLPLVAAAEQSLQLQVSATIPARFCEFPDRCHPVEPSTPTGVSVEAGVIRYIGSPPTVIKNEGLLAIVF